MRLAVKTLYPGKIQLIGFGLADAKPARDFKVGEYRLYNYGHVGKIIHMEPKGTNSIVWTIEQGGKLYPGIVRANTQFAVAPMFSDGTLCPELHKPASLQYNFTKNTCDRCGVTKEEAQTRPPVDTGIDHPDYRYTKSFSLSLGGGVHCAACAREAELERLFAAMDRRDAARAK
jgi:hypothetical protein